jgi:hypothetical protein
MRMMIQLLEEMENGLEGETNILEGKSWQSGVVGLLPASSGLLPASSGLLPASSGLHSKAEILELASYGPQELDSKRVNIKYI